MKDTRLVLPLATMLSVLGMFVWGTWAVLDQKHEVELGIAKVGVQVEAVNKEVRELKRDIDVATKDRWRKTDMKFWCVATEAKNQGFTCPPGFTD